MRHIVDELIWERSNGLRSRPLLWRFITTALYPVLGYKKAIELIDKVESLDGTAVLDFVSNLLELRLETTGIEHIPAEGRAMLIANHPAGIADGVAVYDAIRKRRDDIVFFANRDAIRMAPGLATHVIPVEWVEEKRTRERQREMIRHIVAAFRDEKLVVIFPSGRLAHLTRNGLTERPWQTTAVNLAQKYGCNIVPMHITARNSWFFYFVSTFSAELRDITLFHELLNKKRQRYRLRIGRPVNPAGDVRSVTEALKTFVTEKLSRGEEDCTTLPPAAEDCEARSSLSRAEAANSKSTSKDSTDGSMKASA